MNARALIEEALPPANTTYGFVGSLLQQGVRPGVADVAWDYVSDQLFRLGGSATPEDVRDFLDSRHGRTLTDEMSFYTHTGSDGVTSIDELKVAIDQVLELPWVKRELRKFVASDGIPRQFGSR